jgi:hypothetical protein
MSDAGDNLTSLLREETGGKVTADDRRNLELKSIPAKDRRRMRRAPVKNVQLNIKVTPEFKALLSRLCMKDGVSLAVYIERAVETYSGKEAR